jgi:hypothetical protein
VEPEAIHLNDEFLTAPQKVDLVRADAHVDLRVWELARPDQYQEAFLCLRSSERGASVSIEQSAKRPGAWPARTAGEYGDQLVAAGEASSVCLSEGLLKLAGRDDSRQVGDRACGSGQRDSLELANVAPLKRYDPVGTNPVCSAAVTTRHGHVDLPRCAGEQPPEHSGGAMAHHRSGPAHEYGTQLASSRRREGVADEVNAPVERVETSGFETSVDGMPRQADGAKLSPRHHTTLPGGELGHRALAFTSTGDSTAHTEANPPTGTHAPRAVASPHANT